ncbi:cupredoxin domain-containing protein [Rhodococcus yananensis]|uniref:cupredoxin domain-containing protein n=1 Tax=Rhodococcus yananensis TaxID=2879464 RepID=UPI001CF8547D|nr:cupredoxin domain-containing protein [Rhodococcus yananensis]
MSDTASSTVHTRRVPGTIMIVAAATALGFTAACGDSGDDGAATTTSPAVTAPVTTTPHATESPEAAASEATITIEDSSFGDPITVTPGQVVTVVNLDSAPHTVTANDGTFDVEVAAGETVTFTAPIDPGTYDFHCTYHSGMVGTLTVQ